MTLIAMFKYSEWLKPYSFELKDDAPDYVRKAFQEWNDLYDKLSTPGERKLNPDSSIEIDIFD